MRIAMVGTRGVPARYGGFETAVEEVGRRLAAAGHEVVVYCRNAGQKQRDHLGMRLVNLPALRSRSLETLSHTALSVGHLVARNRPDAAFVFNAANAPLLPVLRSARVPTAVHVDGLEWKRAKWGRAGKAYYRRAEAWSVRLADAVIADSKGIAAYLHQRYGRESVFIPYGAPVVYPGTDLLAEVGLEPRAYHLVVARMEPENHVHVVVEGHLRAAALHPLVVVGSASYANDYTARLDELTRSSRRVRVLGAVWDQELLDQLYAHAVVYWHGHSVGGTNPSLLRAMGAGAAVNAYDVEFNREVADDCAEYFTTAADVAGLAGLADADVDGAAARGARGRDRVAERYRWDDVAESYLSLAASLASRRSTGRGPPLSST